METLQFFKETFSRYKNLFRINPIVVAHDIHPDYLSTKYAKELVKENPQLKAFGVQHHHAHIASCMAENGVDEEVIGVAMDGIGYGTDGAIWGCEFMIADYYGFERVAHLKYIPMPGGDKATLQPWRMTLSYLHSLFGEEIPKDFIRRFGEKETSTILRMISNKINSPLTSSAGRLFDAVSSLIGLRDVIDYEAQAAVELEMVARAGERGEYGFELISNEVLVIDPTLIIAGILYDIKKGLDASIISSKFHNTVVNFILQVVKEIRERRNIKKVALSGGVFQNRLLLEQVKIRLRDENFLPLLHTKVPPNDGGISLGQAVIAGRRSECALEFQQKL
jgi:hydrogenase maturation protein HypF